MGGGGGSSFLPGGRQLQRLPRPEAGAPGGSRFRFVVALLLQWRRGWWLPGALQVRAPGSRQLPSLRWALPSWEGFLGTERAKAG